MRQQPDDTAWPMVSGSFEPWMRYRVEPRYIALAERIVDAAFHVARQVGSSRPHLRGRGPARPFLFRADVVDTGPAKAVAADADAVAQGLAIAEHEIEPPLGGTDQNGAGGISAVKADDGAGNRARAAVSEIRAATEEIAEVSTLGVRGAN